MDLEKLPWTFLYELFKYLDSVETIELLKAIEQKNTLDLRHNERINSLLNKT